MNDEVIPTKSRLASSFTFSFLLQFMPTLTYQFQEQAHRFSLADRVRIGRAEDNDLCVPCDSVSSHHAVIARNGDGFQITDAGSRNGILVGRPKSDFV